MKKLTCFLLILAFCGASYGQGTPIPYYASTWIRTLFDDETQAAAQTTLGLGTGDSPTWAGATITNSAVLGSDSAVFQPNADSTTFFQIKNAAGQSFITGDTTNKYFEIYSDDAADCIRLHHDDSHAWMKWNDGVLKLASDEGTDATTSVYIQGKGTGYGEIRVYDQSQNNSFSITCVSGSARFQPSSGCTETRFDAAATTNITYFQNASEGETNQVKLFGRRTGDSARNFISQISADDNDTVFFDNVGNYEFRDGNFILYSTTHSDADDGGSTKLIGRREDGAGTPTYAGQIEISHDGAVANDQLGKMKLGVNTGAGVVDALIIDSARNIIAEQGVFSMSETTTPTAIANNGALYTTSDNELFFQDGAGTEHLLHGDSFSNIWYHGISTVEVAIAAQNAFAIITSFTVVGHEDDLLNLVGSSANNNLTLSSIGGGEYEISYHGSITATGGADKVMMFALGITLATPKDITNVTDNTVTPIVITSVAHGLENGDMVEIAGVLVNLAANGSFIVDSKANDTFVIVKLDGTATTGNGNYDEGAPTGDVTIVYPGNMVIKRAVRGADLSAISATGLHIISNSDVLALYVANISGATNLTVDAVSLDANRIGD